MNYNNLSVLVPVLMTVMLMAELTASLALTAMLVLLAPCEIPTIIQTSTLVHLLLFGCFNILQLMVDAFEFVFSGRERHG